MYGSLNNLPLLSMPVLRPLPIITKGLSWPRQLWVLLTAVRRYELAETWFFVLPNGQVIIIPRGFIFDGASTPKFLWGLLDPTGILLIQGLVHDFGYRYDYLWAFDEERKLVKLYEGGGRKFWDSLFQEIGRDLVGMHVTGKLSYWALRCFGNSAWKENRKLNESDIVVSY